MQKTSLNKPKKLRVIFDGEPVVMDHFSGIGHYTVELLKEIDHNIHLYPGLKVDMIVHSKRLDKARALGFKNIRLLSSPFSLRISNGLKIRAKQPPLDLLFGRGLYVFPNYTSWPLVASKCVSFIYDLSYEKYPQYASPPLQRFLSTQVWKSVKRSSRIATISNNSRNELGDFYSIPEEKIGVYYPAVDHKRYFKINSALTSKTLVKYGIDVPYILFVGNIEPRKNLVNLLLAYEKLPKKLRGKYKLLLVGAKGWQDNEIHDTIKRLNSKEECVIFPSHYVTDEDIPAFFSGASVFAYPSVYEGFGIPPIEAMACGAPVVCADNSSLPEAAGDAALLVNADSVEDISLAIENVLSDSSLAQKLIDKGYKQAEKFSWEVTARQFLDDLYKLYEYK